MYHNTSIIYYESCSTIHNVGAVEIARMTSTGGSGLAWPLRTLQ